MSTQRSDSTGRSAEDRSTETGRSSRASRAGSTLTRYARTGSLAVVVGCAVLVRGIRTATRNRGRAAAYLLSGTALFAIGLRQRSSDGGSDDDPSALDEAEPPERGTKTVSDDARTGRERDDVMSQPETNPRGVSGEPDVETVTEPDEGDVRFTTDGEEPRSKPSLDDGERTDPRVDGEGDEGVEIDLSETAMADEASEATGPAPEQSEPVQVEDTEPDPSPPEDASHMEADVPDGSGGSSDSETDTERTDESTTADGDER